MELLFIFFCSALLAETADSWQWVPMQLHQSAAKFMTLMLCILQTSRIIDISLHRPKITGSLGSFST
jgi:hypothetical protein